ncbi:hypothetical protein VU05_00220 [Desulfobulbus sp. F1]|nr:hypothetical protein [Desulfobulbus sp. F1]
MKNNEHGFVLIASLLILLVLTLLGLAVNRNTTTEWQISMNDRIHKETFYAADAASELASEVLEQSIACLGFDASASGMLLTGNTAQYNIFVESHALGFWRNYTENGIGIPTDGMDTNGDGIGDGEDCDTNNDNVGDSVEMNYNNCTGSGKKKVPARQIVFPVVLSTGNAMDRVKTNSQPHANINIGGNTKLSEGAAIAMAAGYEGLGKGLGTGGATLLYDINVTQYGQQGSKSVISVQYGHVLGSSGSCNY